MHTGGRLIAGSHNRNEFVLINADENGRVRCLGTAHCDSITDFGDTHLHLTLFSCFVLFGKQNLRVLKIVSCDCCLFFLLISNDARKLCTICFMISC